MFEDYVRLTIQINGEVGQNTMCVAAMIGALVGIKNIPKKFLERVWDFDSHKCDKTSKKRDEIFNQKFMMLHI